MTDHVYGTKALKLLLDNGCDKEQAGVMMGRHYVGPYEDVEDYLWQLVSEAGVPDWIVRCIDFGALADEMERRGEIYTIDTTIDGDQLTFIWRIE